MNKRKGSVKQWLYKVIAVGFILLGGMIYYVEMRDDPDTELARNLYSCFQNTDYAGADARSIGNCLEKFGMDRNRVRTANGMVGVDLKGLNGTVPQFLEYMAESKRKENRPKLLGSITEDGYFERFQRNHQYVWVD